MKKILIISLCLSMILGLCACGNKSENKSGNKSGNECGNEPGIEFREGPPDQRSVSLMMKIVKGKLLLSVKNPTYTIPAFVDGLPLSPKAGHGYGTKSIRYMTERLGGHCQFAVQDDVFSLRVVL